MSELFVLPLVRDEANAFISKHHRHHKPVVGYRFALGLADRDGLLRGVAVVSRPVSRGCPSRDVAEVTRLATDGTPNACSMLYGASARAAKAMGFRKIQTYVLDTEPGTSLRAAGWVREAVTKGGEWTRSDGSARRKDQPTTPKVRWAVHFSRPEITLSDDSDTEWGSAQ